MQVQARASRLLDAVSDNLMKILVSHPLILEGKVLVVGKISGYPSFTPLRVLKTPPSYRSAKMNS
jgi:hypothetical protein